MHCAADAFSFATFLRARQAASFLPFRNISHQKQQNQTLYVDKYWIGA